jgi:hypothetical protein
MTSFAEIDPSRAYTEDNFIHGDPEAIFTAEQPEVLVLWPHGDETLGARLGYHMHNERPDLLERVDYLCGNPLAAAERPAVRDTGGWDLNRAYGPKVPEDTYEFARAQRIKELIEKRDYKFILDMHTTRAEQDDCLILNTEFLKEDSMQKLIAASPVNHVVVFPPHIAHQGLIGHYANSVSIEYNRALADKRGVQDAITTIDGLLNRAPTHEPFAREFYYVDDTIALDMDLGTDPRNFKLTSTNVYPVMIGENTYQNDPHKRYAGFYATQRELIVA